MSVSSTSQQSPYRVDVDVHQGIPASFWQRLPLPWRDMRPTSGISWPAAALGHTGYRSDVHTVAGDHHDTTPQDVVERLLEPHAMDIAILNGNAGFLGVNTHPSADFAINVAQAYNDWLVDVWLSFDSRLKGSMMVAPQDIQASVREIERLGSHPDIVQVILAANSPRLYGDRSYWPIYEAATRHGLPVAIHPTGGTSLPPTAQGWPSTYLEAHTMIATTYLNHLVSLICQGVFEALPDFKFVFIEGGVCTFVPLLWRLEKNWKAVRAEVPWLTRSPSEYLPSNIRFSTQPIEEPADKKLLHRLFLELAGEQTLLYASDWPHWDFDDPEVALRTLPEAMRRRIYGDNARELYQLEG